MFSKTNDLQKAIDQVNNNDGDAADVQSQLGVPPMPPTEGAGVPPYGELGHGLRPAAGVQAGRGQR